MNKNILLLGFIVVGILLIGSALVYATLVFYDDEATAGTANSASGLIAESKAVMIAQNAVPGTLGEVELKKKKSDPNYIFYEVELLDGDIEYEVWVHAVTGTVLSVKQEQSDALSQEDLSKITNRISEEQAKSIALKAVPDGVIVSVETEQENDKALYDIEVDYNGRIASVEIDMVSGAVIGIDLEDESEDDDDDEDEEEDDDD